MKTIDQRIREAAQRKVRVTITGRTRSPKGFTVWWPNQSTSSIYLEREHCSTKAAALALRYSR